MRVPPFEEFIAGVIKQAGGMQALTGPLPPPSARMSLPPMSGAVPAPAWLGSADEGVAA